jgi:hypothetical protein
LRRSVRKQEHPGEAVERSRKQRIGHEGQKRRGEQQFQWINESNFDDLALRQAQRMNALDPSAVTRVDIRVNPRWLRVCDIKQPRTGLEAKFSYAMVTAMTLHGVDTASDATYTDALCCDTSLSAFWPKVVVTGDQVIGDTAAAVRIKRVGAPATAAVADLAERLPADALERRLRDKAAALVGRDAAEALWLEVARLESLSASRLARNLRAR